MHGEETRTQGKDAPVRGDGAPIQDDGAPIHDEAAVPGHGARMPEDGARILGDGASMIGDAASMIGDAAPMIGDAAPMIGDGAAMHGGGAPILGDGLRVDDRFAAAPTFGEFLEGVEAYRGVWYSVSRRSSAPDDLVSEACALPGHWYMLALAADWCGDALDPIPLIADLADRVEQLELRVVDRDDHLDLMDAHLTEGNRSIPAVIVYDGRFRDLGHWGPRPAPLQKWWLGARDAGVPEADRFREVRRWYRADEGRTTIQELISLCRGV